VNPLFLYIPVINRDDKCLTLDRRLMITALCLRSVSDATYVGNIIFGNFNRRRAQEPPQMLRYLRMYFAIDILAILPIPQVIN
jgi:cyclic nucleotide gated channel